MRTKILALLLCVISVFSLAGCVNVDVKDNNVKVDVGNIHVDVENDDNVDVKID